MSRRTLSDAQWARIEQLVPGKSTDRGRSGEDNRLFVDAVLWMARSCAPWRDLPPELGKWATVHSRFRRWTLSGVWENLFNALAHDPDFEYVKAFAHSGTSGRSFQQHPVSHSGVSGHLGSTLLSVVS